MQDVYHDFAVLSFCFIFKQFYYPEGTLSLQWVVSMFRHNMSQDFSASDADILTCSAFYYYSLL